MADKGLEEVPECKTLHRCDNAIVRIVLYGALAFRYSC